MSKGNIEILRRMYEAAKEGNWESVLRDYAHPDCEASFVTGSRNAPRPRSTLGGHTWETAEVAPAAF